MLGYPEAFGALESSVMLTPSSAREEVTMPPKAMSNLKRLWQIVLAGCLLIVAATADKAGAEHIKGGQVVSVQVFTSASIDNR